MSNLTGLGKLSTDDWRRLGELADRLEKEWQESETVDLRRLLPPEDDPLRRTILVELIKTELEIRWRQKRGVTVDHYLQRFPELGGTEQLPLSLIYEEYRVRQRYGDNAPLESYRGRFPSRFENLQRMVQDNPVPTAQTGLDTPPAQPPAQPPAPARPMRMEPEANQLIGGYTREKLIGRGGFGEVWKGMAPGGFPVAIKIITRPSDHEERQREEKALEVVKSLTHHFLIRTHAYYSDQDRLYIVMDLADSSLRDRFKEARNAGKKGIPKDELLRWFKESAEALDYLHEKGVMHRDIKPDNILLVEGHARLADFGLMRQQSQILVSVSGSGTPAYMAPEVWRGHASRASDQYSLAYAYAELRMGCRPFSSTDYAGVMLDHLDNVPDLGDLPESEKQVLLKALAKNPEQRFASCSEFMRGIEGSSGTGGFTPLVNPGGPSPQTQSNPRGGTTQSGANKPNVTGKSGAKKATTEHLGTQIGQLPDRTAARQSAYQEAADTPEVSPRPQKSRTPLILALVGGAVVLLGGIGFVLFRPSSDTKKQDNAPVVPETTPKVEVVKPPPPPPPPLPNVPSGFKAATEEIVQDMHKRKFVKVIVPERAGLPEMRYLLIPQLREEDPPTFYMMETKVSSAMFATLTGKAVPSGPRGRLPAFGMTAEQATDCAKYLGGQLPTARQWDKAAGFWDRDGRNGPAKGSDVAVKQRGLGPRPVDAPGNDDVSVFNVLGMAGNGTELTRDVLEPLGGRKLVVLRGQRYEASSPLSFADLKKQQEEEKDTQVQYYTAASPFTGFRVVVELPAK